MRAQRFISTVGSLCLAAGTAFGQAPVGPVPGPVPHGFPASPPNAAFVPPGDATQQLMPVAPGYGMLPQQGLPGLQSPPGDVGLEAYAGVGPQELGRQLGTQPGQVPGIPQAWAMSVWNPSPYFVIKAELMFLRTDFNAPNSEPLDGDTLAAEQRVAIQADVDRFGQMSLVNRTLGIDTPYLVAPRLTGEWFNTDRCKSFEVGVWASVGPARDYKLGREDFPYFVTLPVDGPNGPVIPVTNTPAAFPDVVDDVLWRYTNQLANLEGMYWVHYTPEKGAVADCAWGFGARYFFIHEKIRVDYRNFENNDFQTVGQLTGRSKNDLFGVQFGGKAILQSPWKWIRSSVEAKIGLMSNDARNNTEVVDTTGAVAAQGRWVRHQFSPLFEGNYNMEFFVSQYVTFYAGFHVLYADRLDRASEQFKSDLAAFTSTQKNQSDALIFGPKVGFMMNW
jgi:hypothetical protein